jgi:hypothetical protein
MVFPLVLASLLAPFAPAMAQTAAKPADKPAAKAPAKPAATAAKPAAKPAASTGNKGLARSAQKAVEENTPIEDDPSITLTEADQEVAKQVYVGEMPCELGAKVNVRPARRTGLFVITTKGYRFLMHPVESRTGAIRLEDAKRGAMWLQLGNKSMLMSQKLGQRLADECQSPQQVTFAEELKRNPRPSILDAQPVPGPGGNPSASSQPTLPVPAASAADAAQPAASAAQPAASTPTETPAAAAPAATDTNKTQ